MALPGNTPSQLRARTALAVPDHVARLAGSRDCLRLTTPKATAWLPPDTVMPAPSFSLRLVAPVALGVTVASAPLPLAAAARARKRAPSRPVLTSLAPADYEYYLPHPASGSYP